MDHRELFEKVVLRYTAGPYSEELQKARKEYSEIAGRIFEDDKSYNTYNSFFLEWYLLEWHLKESGKTPIKTYLEGSDPFITDEERDLCMSYINSKQSVFDVKALKKGLITLRDLFTKDKYKVITEEQNGGFRKGDIMETRLIPEGDNFHLGSACRFHPSKAGRLIEKQLKLMRKSQKDDETLKEFILKLGNMNLTWERSRNIEVGDIYKW